MEDNTVALPVWALPLVLSIGVGLMSYGAAQANSESSQQEVRRIERLVDKTMTSTTENSKNSALNSQAIKQIAEALSDQAETTKATDAKLGQLIQIMLNKQP